MSLTAAAIRMMAEKGLSAVDIADIAEANEKRADPTNAARQAKHREKVKRERNGVTVTRVTPPLIEEVLIPPDSPVVSDETTPAPKPELRVEHVVDFWNETAAKLGLQQVKRMTPERQRKVGIRIRQNTVDDFTEAIAAIARSPFLRGENDRGWRATFDWLLEPRNFAKLIEGTYDR